MKKTLIAFAAALAVLTAAAVNVSAANKDFEIWKGTPIVDGKLDDNYLKSASYSMDYANNVGWSFGTKTSDEDAEVTSYFLYDDNYLFVYHQVTDSNITTPTDETIFTDQSKHYCKIDEVELVFTDATETRNLTKVLADGSGKMVQLFSMQTAGFPLELVAVDKAPEYATAVPSVKGYLDSKYGDMSSISPVKAAYTKTKVGYDWEIAIPISDEYKTSGFGLIIQLSDVDDPTGMENGQFLQPKDTLIVKYSSNDAGSSKVETAASDDGAIAPATADAAGLMSLALVSAGAAAAVAIKSKKN